MGRSIDTFSHTMLSTWRRCRYRFDRIYKDGYVSAQSIGQARGSAGHAALAFYYENDRNIEMAIQEAWEKFFELLGETPEQSEWDLLEGALIRYHEWAKKNDNFTVVDTEQHFELQFPNGKLQGFIDGIVKAQGRLWILEHKFNKRVETGHLDIDPQVSIYMLAASLLGYKPIGVMYNIIRVGTGPTAEREPVVRKFLYRNPEGLNYFADEIDQQMIEINRHLSEGGFSYRNMTSNCSWDCPFYSVCLSLNDSGDGSAVLERMERKPFNDDNQ
jgi:hypothetical protein